ncbi:RnfABCDGE type electron transport complex subunit D [Maridesulfovibrio salexigens]|uniref:Electron transport complex, RnfABCDGE type, D subunit n=1 Tax=Maridesulfovibrio salexigens (strain ATCC 14822 / DSM 2638 / NCIMB 8403 / VKM B-1763) TaxID=526222 RepID=C6BZS9_MARSD|nr:RnfABCDGE type electron transport complex subunit D [Maridesulfovibrio salexigens]ACS78986.1 electron transport complex, RnfABCDGE type, D subunit [Maridesulfovibrio salexigens DSM 2638]
MTPPVIKAMSDIAVRLTVSPAPHWRSKRTVEKMMQSHLLALVPALLMAFNMFGLPALATVGIAGTAAVLAEVLCLKMQNRDVNVDNYTALYEGLLFVFLLPAGAPWWLVASGAVLTIVLGRTVFGGFGSNPICAPLVAWAFCRLSWPAAMDIDANLAHFMINAPLDQLKFFGLDTLEQFNYTDLFLGKQLGGLGASQILAVLAGGIFLIATGWVRVFIPAAFLVGVTVTASIFWMIDPEVYANPLFHLLTGSVMFGAFFLAPDVASSPVGMIPQILFGLIAGTMVIIIRVYGIYPDGVPFAIMVANLLTPLLDRVRPKPFGGK